MATEFNTKVYLRESPYDNPMELECYEIKQDGAFMVFHCSDDEILRVPIANLQLVEEGEYVSDDEEEKED